MPRLFNKTNPEFMYKLAVTKNTYEGALQI